MLRNSKVPPWVHLWTVLLTAVGLKMSLFGPLV